VIALFSRQQFCCKSVISLRPTLFDAHTLKLQKLLVNYFELYGIPESFLPDEPLLKKKYYSLSRQYHPDFHANENPERQKEVLELSTLNTNAYRTLSDFDRRMQYILQQHGLLEEGQKNEMPADFLMEMMEINEQIMELEFDADPEVAERLRLESEALLAQLDNDIRPHLERYPEASRERQEQIRQQAKGYFQKKKYLLRIRESLNKFATRS
jgi:molecular chaperone HscB